MMDESQINWREVVDTADGRDEMIVANWQRLAAAAWDGYLKAGRGAVLLNLKSASAGVIVESSYLPLESLSALADQSGKVPEVLSDQLDRLRDYNPQREIVLFIVSDEGNTVRCRRLHADSEELLDPPEAYRAEGGVQHGDSYLN